MLRTEHFVFFVSVTPAKSSYFFLKHNLSNSICSTQSIVDLIQFPYLTKFLLLPMYFYPDLRSLLSFILIAHGNPEDPSLMLTHANRLQLVFSGPPVVVKCGFYIVSFGSISEINMVCIDIVLFIAKLCEI